MSIQKKYWYKVWQEAEGLTTAWVHLTEKQAEAVAYATDRNNWIKAYYESFSGQFSIDLDSKQESEPESSWK